jgi:hypothetical protein
MLRLISAHKGWFPRIRTKLDYARRCVCTEFGKQTRISLNPEAEMVLDNLPITQDFASISFAVANNLAKASSAVVTRANGLARPATSSFSPIMHTADLIVVLPVIVRIGFGLDNLNRSQLRLGYLLTVAREHARAELRNKAVLHDLST